MAPSLPALRDLVRDQPYDAAARAILADLLAERGDPRGLFIQAQVNGQRELAAQLLERYRGHFLHPLSPRADVDFESGFVERWRTTPAEFRSVGRRMLRTWPLRTLVVAGARAVDVQYVLESFGIERVNELSFPRLVSRGLEYLARVTLPPVAAVHLSGELMDSEVSSLPSTPLGDRLRASAREVRGRFAVRWLEDRFSFPFGA